MRAVLMGVLLVAACGTTTDPSEVPTPIATDLANPLGPEVPLYPWPSEQYLVADATTATGVRVQVDAELMPQGLSPSLVDTDGFSRVQPLVTWLPGGFDAATLPDPAVWDATLSSTASVLVVREDDLSLVPVMAEFDQLAPEPAQQSLILRPHRTFAPGTRYAVLIFDTVTAADGSPHARPRGLDALLSGEVGDSRPLGAQLPGFAMVPDALEAHGRTADELLLAWTFRTRSEAVIDVGVATQDHAADAPLGTFTAEPIRYEDDRAVLEGTLTVPRYLDDLKRIHLDDDGAVIVQGTMEAPVILTVPKTVTETRPLLIVGHGFFSDPEEVNYGTMFGGLRRWEMSAVATEFFGFSEGTALEALPILSGDLDALPTIIDQQLQSQANFTAMTRLMVDELADTVEVDFGDGAFKPLDKAKVHYIGASNGGTQGAVMMTTSKVLTRGVLVVPGGGWSHMLQRASQWTLMAGGLESKFSDARELQLAISMMQLVFDPVDSLNYTDHLLRDRLPGRPADPEVLFVEAVGDAQVSNLVSRWLGGNAGAPLITPTPEPVWGMEPLTTPSMEGIGYAMHDLLAPRLAPGNVPPVENGVHGAVRTTQAYYDQVGTFLETGELIHPCDGPCDPD